MKIALLYLIIIIKFYQNYRNNGTKNKKINNKFIIKWIWLHIR
jgi:hypothetical protein